MTLHLSASVPFIYVYSMHMHFNTSKCFHNNSSRCVFVKTPAPSTPPTLLLLSDKHLRLVKAESQCDLFLSSLWGYFYQCGEQDSSLTGRVCLMHRAADEMCAHIHNVSALIRHLHADVRLGLAPRLPCFCLLFSRWMNNGLPD